MRTAAEAGADAILILLRDLDDDACRRLMQAAADRGLDAFVEAHDADELGRALALGADPIGVNARDLSTFAIDRRTQLELVAAARRKAADRVVVAESGIWNRAQGAEAELAGADAILVGSALMRAPDPAARLAELIARPLVKVCGLTRDEDVPAPPRPEPTSPASSSPIPPVALPSVLPVPDTMLSVAVFVGAAEDSGADLVQLYEEEDGHRGRDAVLLREGQRVAEVVDLPWLGEGTEHWPRAAQAEGRVMLAGGLAPENVGAAVEAVRPWAVDAARSLEAAPGIKDHERVRAFVRAVEEVRT